MLRPDPRSYRGWSFIGRNLDALRSVDELASEAEELAANRAAVPLSEEELAAARNDSIELRYLDKFTKTSKCALVVSGCSIRVVNGRFIERGSSDGSFLFRNVRGWVIFKRRLVEVPELGISLQSCFNSAEGLTISALMERRTQEAVSLSVSREKRPPTARSDRSLFLDVVSAGLRQITAEQTAQSLRNMALLASERSVAAFRRLHSRRRDYDASNDAVDTDAYPIPDSSAGLISSSIAPMESDGGRRLLEPTQQPLISARGELGCDEAEIGMRSILAKGIEYQVASCGYSEYSSARTAMEAELSLELLCAIERRESILGEAMAASSQVRLSFLQI